MQNWLNPDGSGITGESDIPVIKDLLVHVPGRVVHEFISIDHLKKGSPFVFWYLF